MLRDSNKRKLLELSEKAMCIEKEILQEEEKYQNALILDAAISFLLPIREKIKKLQRKEILYSGAIEMKLRKVLTTDAAF